VPGNHDVEEVIRKQSTRAVTVPAGSTLELADLELVVSHHYDAGVDGGDFCLYGHTPEPDHHRKGDMVCLNGISTVTVIEAPSRRTHFLPYPSGTDNVRTSLLPKPGL
jgi:predicted phosphodiesterase